MRALAVDLDALLRRARPFVLVTVTGVQGSAPRGLGAAMAVTENRVIGSLTGGCVEGAVVYDARSVLAGDDIVGGGPVLTAYGCSTDPFAPRMTCGGVIEVLVQRIDHISAAPLRMVLSALETDTDVALATSLGGATPLGAMTAVTADRVAGARAQAGPAMALLGRGGVRRHDAADGLHAGATGPLGAGTLLVQSFPSRPRLLVFGGNDVAAELSRHGRALGYRVSVCDPRAAFATPERFPHADEVVMRTPHRYLAEVPLTERDVVCVLTHDPKFDEPLLEIALRSPAAYVGAMGSRRAHRDRIVALRERGIGEADLARLRSPIGLDLGAVTAAETAISILAEVLQTRHAASGQPLRRTCGPIHANDSVASRLESRLS